MRKTLIGAAFVVCALAGFVAAGQLATAQVGELYNPSNCARFDGVFSITNSGVVNNDTSVDWIVYCPGDRQTFGSNPNVDGWVRVRDENATLNFSCTLYSHNIEATGINFDTQASSGTGGQTLNFNAISNATDYSYSIQCTVPRKSTFASAVDNYYIEG